MKTSFAITELEDDPSESQAELANYFNKLDKKLKEAQEELASCSNELGENLNESIVFMSVRRSSYECQWSWHKVLL